MLGNHGISKHLGALVTILLLHDHRIGPPGLLSGFQFFETLIVVTTLQPVSPPDHTAGLGVGSCPKRQSFVVALSWPAALPPLMHERIRVRRSSTGKLTGLQVDCSATVLSPVFIQPLPPVILQHMSFVLHNNGRPRRSPCAAVDLRSDCRRH